MLFYLQGDYDPETFHAIQVPNQILAKIRKLLPPSGLFGSDVDKEHSSKPESFDSLGSSLSKETADPSLCPPTILIPAHLDV